MKLEIKEYKDITAPLMEKELAAINVEVPKEAKTKEAIYEIYKEAMAEAIAEQEEIKAIEIKKEEEKKDITRKIEVTDMVEVKSVNYCGLTYISPKTKIEYTWGDYGDIELIEFGELRTMLATSKEFLTAPKLIIEDKAVVHALNLTRVYNEFLSQAKINVLLDLPLEQIKEEMAKMSENDKRKIAEVVYREKGKSFNDYNKIEYFTKELNIHW